MSAIEAIVTAARGRAKVRQYQKGYYATCNPTREDRRPSLLFGENLNGKPWFKDLGAETDPAAILRAWGLNPDTLEASVNQNFKPQPGPRRQSNKRRIDFAHPDASYNYTFSDGTPSYQVRRFNFTRPDGTPDKEFIQYHWGPNGRYQPGRGETPELLYRLPEVVKSQWILGVEGEGVAEALRALGYVATTHAGGAKAIDKALPAYRDRLRDKDFIFLPDNDQPGKDMAQALANNLGPVVASGATVDPALFGGEKADIADLIDRLKKEMLSDEEIKAEIDRILSQAQPWQPVSKAPGPKELERLAVREKYLTEARARREALQTRQQAHYKADIIPFVIADDEEYQREVSRVRETFTSAAAWREFVTFNFDELDPEHEYRVKIEENKEAKMAFCGKPYKRLTATGEIKAGRILCGLCESCKKLDRLNLRRALETAILADPEQCLMIVTVACKAERARITRRLRENRLLDKVLPVASELQGEYDILMPSAAADLVGEYEPRELLIAHLNDARLDRWLMTPAGERQSGKLIPSRRELREVGEPDRFERDPDYPDVIPLDLPGVVCEGFLPEVAIDHEVHDATGLQSALNEIADRQRKILFKRGHVIYGVITSKKYYALSDVPTICQLFNERNEALKAKIEARRRKK